MNNSDHELKTVSIAITNIETGEVTHDTATELPSDEAELKKYFERKFGISL